MPKKDAPTLILKGGTSLSKALARSAARKKTCADRRILYGAASIVVGKFVGPHLLALEHTQDANGIAVDQVRRNIRCTRNDQLARPSDTPRPTAIRKVEEAPRGSGNLFVDMNRSARILGLDIAENAVAIGQRETRPDEFHRSCSGAFRSAAARRCAKCVSTSESSISGRVSANAWRTFSRNQLS